MILVLVPYIVDLDNMPQSDRDRAFALMDRMGELGATMKAGTLYAYMFLRNEAPVSELANALGIDDSRITNAKGWDMMLWLKQ